MLNFKDYLAEGRDAPLYHGTSTYFIVDIINSNILKATTYISLEDYKNKYGVSLTRDFKYAKFRSSKKTNRGAYYPIVLELNQRKLAQRYKILPYDFFSGTTKKYGTKELIYPIESEELVVGSIKNLSTYITKIHINKDSKVINLIRKKLPGVELVDLE